jgi:uncharacterized protein
MAHILITGVTGMMGSFLSQKLMEAGHLITGVSRSSQGPDTKKFFKGQLIPCDLTRSQISSDWDSLLESVDFIIHLSGASVGTSRWTDSYREEMLKSRVFSTENLRLSLERLKKSSLKGYLGASAIGCYPHHYHREYTEEFPVEKVAEQEIKTYFLRHLVFEWEKQHSLWGQKFPHIHKTSLRFGLVHGYPGGVLGEVVPLFKRGLGAPLGSGDQWVSWIDLEDVLGVIEWLLSRSAESLPWSPVYNLVSPDCVTQKEWSKAIAQCFHVSLLPKVPSFVLKTLLGQRASLMLDSQKVKPKALESEGYVFREKTLKDSLQQLY